MGQSLCDDFHFFVLRLGTQQGDGKRRTLGVSHHFDRIIGIVFKTIVHRAIGHSSILSQRHIAHIQTVVFPLHNLQIGPESRHIQGGGHLTDAAAYTVLGAAIGKDCGILKTCGISTGAHCIVIRKHIPRVEDLSVDLLGRQLHIGGTPCETGIEFGGTAAQSVPEQHTLQLFCGHFWLDQLHRNLHHPLFRSIHSLLGLSRIKFSPRLGGNDGISRRVVLQVQIGAVGLHRQLVVDILHTHRTGLYHRSGVFHFALRAFPEMLQQKLCQVLFVHLIAGLPFVHHQCFPFQGVGGFDHLLAHLLHNGVHLIQHLLAIHIHHYVHLSLSKSSLGNLANPMKYIAFSAIIPGIFRRLFQVIDGIHLADIQLVFCTVDHHGHILQQILFLSIFLLQSCLGFFLLHFPHRQISHLYAGIDPLIQKQDSCQSNANQHQKSPCSNGGDS